MVICTFISFLSCCQYVHASTSSREEYEKTGHVIWEIKTKEKMVALTFDDGPDPLYTPQILDILAKYNAKATFFVIGSEAEKYPNIIKREVKEGHEVANHTYNHIYNFHADPENIKYELNTATNTIDRITGGYKSSLFRPVAGYINDFIIKNAIKNGYNVVLWSWHQDTRDWSKPGVEKITTHVISNTRPGDIILFHDSGGDRTQTVKALKNILDFYMDKGFECVTISDMLYRSETFHK
jgi:peptidoglycan/xylan/chitin deacetylase (PgdA/CDA1 family)